MAQAWAVQLAQHFGAHVTAVCSTSKVEFVRTLGAASVIDYTTMSFPTDGRFDVILDLAGNRPLSVLRMALASRGTLVIGGGEDGDRFFGGGLECVLDCRLGDLCLQRGDVEAGAGQRGDMKAVVRAILLDSEARTVSTAPSGPARGPSQVSRSGSRSRQNSSASPCLRPGTSTSTASGSGKPDRYQKSLSWR